MKRHMWRAHTPIECSLCGANLESRQGLKHHKEDIHKVTKTLECKHAKDGNCLDGEECLFNHDGKLNESILSENKNESELMSSIQCKMCPNLYESEFKLKRHEWRAHEKVDCRLCGQASQSREDLENHKRVDHGITKRRDCTFWANGTCVDGVECLFIHGIQNHNINRGNNRNDKKTGSENNVMKFCKQGLKCNRKCGISKDGHQKVKDIPCKFGQSCNRSKCYFKHNEAQGAGFQGNQRNRTDP